ncbi:MAG: DUF115 domain-containing protein [Euryarchaeota archaeon]|nr:DUF115 domain-containing protein [Euryarchaeota archaeon]
MGVPPAARRRPSRLQPPVPWPVWEPIYREILRDFGFDPLRDTESARVLDGLLRGRPIPDLGSLLRGRRVAVCGKAPCLARDLEGLRAGEVVVAADGATTTLLEYDRVPSLIVSDLDGRLEDLRRAGGLGAVLVVHAHGDNVPRLPFVSRLERVLGTTQGEPFGCLRNYGGFTDGDRAVFAALAHGARGVRLLGFDFDDPGVGAVKRKKLMWARRLLRMAGVV